MAEENSVEPFDALSVSLDARIGLGKEVRIPLAKQRRLPGQTTQTEDHSGNSDTLATHFIPP